jgi:hypothetical protein
MIIKRKTMYELGFKTMGLDFGSNASVNRYTKYYDKQLYLLVADAFNDGLFAFKFKDKKEMKDFRGNKFAITIDSNRDGNCALGGGRMKFIPSVDINRKLNIVIVTKRKHLLDGIELFEKKILNQ